MTKISRKKVDPVHLGFFINNFWNSITLLEDKNQVKSFLKDLLSHTEMKMFAKRIQIAKMLLEGHGYEVIKNQVKVTDSTIAKISNMLEIGGEGIRMAVKYLQKFEKDIEKDRFRLGPDFKKKYGMYFLPEKLIESAEKQARAYKKKQSVKKDIPL